MFPLSFPNPFAPILSFTITFPPSLALVRAEITSHKTLTIWQCHKLENIGNCRLAYNSIGLLGHNDVAPPEVCSWTTKLYPPVRIKKLLYPRLNEY